MKIEDVSEILFSISSQFIKLPELEEFHILFRLLEILWSVSGTILSMDGTHIQSVIHLIEMKIIIIGKYLICQRLCIMLFKEEINRHRKSCGICTRFKSVEKFHFINNYIINLPGLYHIVGGKQRRYLYEHIIWPKFSKYDINTTWNIEFYI